ncbi:MAG TPA: glutathione binding-like protein [Rhodocyclaceae bacterium]|nr:glutathione binding-like protein [Rhodocyclaceae bacterium]
MISLYTWGTPNGHKVSIMLEEIGTKYRTVPVHIGKGDQFTAAFAALNPNNKIPVIVDDDGPDGKPITLIESGAILIYLAGKSGRFLPVDLRDKYEALQWLMFQMGSVGPMLGQAHHFLRARTPVPYGVARYVAETRRIYGVLQARLADRPYLAGNDYSIADIATWPWIHRNDMHQVDLADFPNVKRWYDEIARRPAVQRGIKKP